MISVVIPYHGRIDLVIKCVESIAISLPPGSEILLIDDGTEETESATLVDYCTSLRQERLDLTILTFHYKRSGNVSFLRNEGARQSSGDLLVFADSDVAVSEDWFSEVTRFLGDHPDCGCVSSIVYGPDGNVQHSGLSFSSRIHAILYLFSRGTKEADHYKVDVVNNIFALRKDAFLKCGGFNNEIAIMGDETWLQFSLRAVGYYSYMTTSTKAYHMKPSITSFSDRVRKYDSSRHKSMVMEGIIIQSYFLRSLPYIVFYSLYVIRQLSASLIILCASLVGFNGRIGLRRFFDTVDAILVASAMIVRRRKTFIHVR